MTNQKKDAKRWSGSAIKVLEKTPEARAEEIKKPSNDFEITQEEFEETKKYRMSQREVLELKSGDSVTLYHQVCVNDTPPNKYNAVVKAVYPYTGGSRTIQYAVVEFVDDSEGIYIGVDGKYIRHAMPPIVSYIVGLEKKLYVPDCTDRYKKEKCFSDVCEKYESCTQKKWDRTCRTIECVGEGCVVGYFKCRLTKKI